MVLLFATYLIYASLAIFITWNLSKVREDPGNCSVIPDMNAGDISEQNISMFFDKHYGPQGLS